MTRSMFARIGLTLLLLTPVLLMGARPRPHPYAGSWSGSWESLSGLGEGDITVIISTTGSATGYITNVDLDLAGPLVGKMSRTGKLSGTLTYEGSSPSKITGNATIQGSVMSGLFTQKIGRTRYGGSFTAQRTN